MHPLFLSKDFLTTASIVLQRRAVRSFARCWTVDLKERKIRVNALSPGPIETSVFKNIATGEEEKKIQESMAAHYST